jgi:hypothetical protein
MYPFVPFQVVIPIEALWTLITLEWSVIRSLLRMRRVAKKVRHRSRMSTVEALHHARMHITNQRKLAIRVADVGEDGSRVASIRSRIGVR